MNAKPYLMTINILLMLLGAAVFLYGNLGMFIMIYTAVFIFTIIRTCLISSKKLLKIFLIIAFLTVYVVQLNASGQLIGAIVQQTPEWEALLRRFFCVALTLLPVVISRYITIGKYAQFYLPSLQEMATVSFAQAKANADQLAEVVGTITTTGKNLSQDNLKEIMQDLPRHDSFRYINDGSLTDAYFEKAAQSLADPYLYIVVSSTGSAASELISIFTQKQYNHASLSFDKELETIISYNGGERVYPPGLNHEMISFFNKKPDASILVYRLSCKIAQKKKILNKIEEINKEGSAYNMMGLVTKYSHKPNIMFCSQFVYQMLRMAGLAYFDKKDGTVRPTELIELDYRRRLEFVYEIKPGRFGR